MHTAQADVGVDFYRTPLGGWFAAFPDADSTWADVVVEEDRLFYHLDTTGTPTTGKSVHFTEVYISHIDNGKLAVGSGLMDTATFLSQLQGARWLGDEKHVPLFDPDGGQWLMP